MIGRPPLVATLLAAAALCTPPTVVLTGCTPRAPAQPETARSAKDGTAPRSRANGATATGEWIAAEDIVGTDLPETDPAFENWPVRPLIDYRAMQVFDGAPMEIVESRHSGGGTTGAERMDILLPTIGHQCRLKTKKFPRSLDGFNNSPRKEIAAYAIQRILFEPEDYVVPTTLARCVPIEVWQPRHTGDEPTLAGTRCVLVITALWLRDVTLPDPLLDEARFASDPDYAQRLSNFNLFTYVVDHRDGRTGNFLVSKNEERRHVFAVDNGISFNPWVYNYFVPNWYKLRVPAIRRDSVERLRPLERKDLDFLAVVAQLETDDAGVMHMRTPTTVDDPDDGATVFGDRLQLGLTRKEIDAVWKRIRHLIEGVDTGTIETF